MYKEFLSPIPQDEYSLINSDDEGTMAHHLSTYLEEFPDLEDIQIAIFSVEEDRGSVDGNRSSDAGKMVRKAFYELYNHHPNVKIADVGVLKQGHSLADTYTALAEICSGLMAENVLPIIIGGSQDLSYAQYLGYEDEGKFINLLFVDEKIDINGNGEMSNTNYLQNIITHSPSMIFDMSVAAYQQFLVSPKAVAALQQQGYDLYRLGEVQRNLADIEPVIRNSHMISFDFRSIRMSDAPGARNSSVNGLFGQEACKIAQYAGMNERLTSFGIYELNAIMDDKMQSPDLVAQMIWYLIDGYSNRKHDFPNEMESDYVKYTVDFETRDHQLVFWNSKKSSRWWVEMPVLGAVMTGENFYIPCSYNDYQNACQNEIPERWIRAFEKLA